MAASLGLREGESAAGLANDSQIPIEPEKENVESPEKKVMNGFLVSLSGELMAASSSL